jgi:hypothetical protein
MPGTRWIKVDATIVECFRAWNELARSAHPWFEIVADIKTSTGEVERVTSHQRLNTLTHHWRAPDPGDVVPARTAQAAPGAASRRLVRRKGDQSAWEDAHHSAGPPGGRRGASVEARPATRLPLAYTSGLLAEACADEIDAVETA